MANVLVAYGSKMGGTAEIASWITDTLDAAGHVATCMEADRVRDVSGYDAVVVGSSLYAGRWRREVVSVLKRLGRRSGPPPVWLFHSGPLGDDKAHEDQPFPRNVEAAVEKLDVRGHVTFGGRLPDDPPGWIATKMADNGLAGDWREEDAVKEWARGIAAEVTALRAHV